MRERPDVVDVPSGSEEVKKKRLDLSVPQVAGSALAAVAAAKLASSFGVYGTILGAGVVSVIATCGGSLLQHFFSRTGEQLREVNTSAAPTAPGEYSVGTVHRARWRAPGTRGNRGNRGSGGSRRKRPLIAAALVFGVTMAGITTYELASGTAFSGGSGTTVGDAVKGRGSASTPSSTTPSTPGADEGATPSQEGSPAAGGDATVGAGDSAGTAAPDATPSPEPSATAGDGASAGGTAGESTAPGASATAPAPSADSRSGTADPGPTGPAAP